MMTIDAWIQVIAAFCGTFGFGILFNIRGLRLLATALGGMIAWLLFLWLGTLWENEIFRYFLVSVCLSLYAEVMARLMKTPTTTFCITSLIVLVPGSSLYYSAQAAFDHDWYGFFSKALYTIELVVALSVGILLVTGISRCLLSLRNRLIDRRRTKTL